MNEVEDEFSPFCWDLKITLTCQIIWTAMKITGQTQNKNLKRNDAHKTCFTVLITNFRKCPDSVTAGSASYSHERDRESGWICVTGSCWWSKSSVPLFFTWDLRDHSTVHHVRTSSTPRADQKSSSWDQTFTISCFMA